MRKKFSVFIAATRTVPPTGPGAAGRGLTAVYAAGAVGWIRYRLKSNPSTPTVPWTVSPPRKRLASDNGLPFGMAQD